MESRHSLLKRIGITGAALALIACGGGGGGSDAPASSGDANSATERTIKGSLTGDLSQVEGVRARSVGDNVSYEATVATTARLNGLTGSGATFTVTVPTGKSYHLEAYDASRYVIGTLTFTNGAGGANTSEIPLSGGSTSVDLGSVDVPDGTDSSHHAELSPEHNPLHDVDTDDDGIDNYADTDDDNDSIDDMSDTDADGDGIDDAEEETDDSSDDSGGSGHGPDADDDGDDSDDASGGSDHGSSSGAHA